jgi:hypothetical protein
MHAHVDKPKTNPNEPKAAKPAGNCFPIFISAKHARVKLNTRDKAPNDGGDSNGDSYPHKGW